MGALVSVRRSGTVAVLDVAGDIDLASSPEMRRALLFEIRENHTAKVICNLSQVQYIDSSGIASFVEGLKASRDLGTRLILLGLTSTAREVLQLSRLLHFFEIYESESEALQS